MELCPRHEVVAYDPVLSRQETVKSEMTVYVSDHQAVCSFVGFRAPRHPPKKNDTRDLGSAWGNVGKNGSA